MFEDSAIDGAALAQLIRQRQLTSVEAVTASIGRIEQTNPAVNAVVTPIFEAAIAQARAADRRLATGEPTRPLHGVPILIKDLFDFKAGVRNTFGCTAMADFVPNESVAHVERLEAAGAIIVGKTNTPEFGHKGVTDNRLFGPTSTPFDPARNAGGSSGGSAAAVAAGMTPMAQGSDAGGSVRIPAAWCGVVGFKPTFGRIPNTGSPNAFGAHTPFVHVGPITRTVRDAALMADVMIGPDPRDPFSLPASGVRLLNHVAEPIQGLRIGWTADWGVFAVEADVAKAAQSAVVSLQDAGAIVEPVALKLPCCQDELAELWCRQVGVIYADMFASFTEAGMDLLADDPEAVPEAVRAMAEYGAHARALDARKDDWLRTQILTKLEDAFSKYDLLATPTLSCRPPRNADNGCTLGPKTVDGKPVERCIGWCMTHPVNFTGHPAASAPAGLLHDGLPVGLQLVGPRFADGRVLAACAALEQVRPWNSHYARFERRLKSR